MQSNSYYKESQLANPFMKQHYDNLVHLSPILYFQSSSKTSVELHNDFAFRKLYALLFHKKIYRESITRFLS